MDGAVEDPLGPGRRGPQRRRGCCVGNVSFVFGRTATARTHTPQPHNHTITYHTKRHTKSHNSSPPRTPHNHSPRDTTHSPHWDRRRCLRCHNGPQLTTHSPNTTPEQRRCRQFGRCSGATVGQHVPHCGGPHKDPHKRCCRRQQTHKTSRALAAPSVANADCRCCGLPDSVTLACASAWVQPAPYWVTRHGVRSARRPPRVWRLPGASNGNLWWAMPCATDGVEPLL